MRRDLVVGGCEVVEVFFVDFLVGGFGVLAVDVDFRDYIDRVIDVSRLVGIGEGLAETDRDIGIFGFCGLNDHGRRGFDDRLGGRAAGCRAQAEKRRGKRRGCCSESFHKTP